MVEDNDERTFQEFVVQIILAGGALVARYLHCVTWYWTKPRFYLNETTKY